MLSDGTDTCLNHLKWDNWGIFKVSEPVGNVTGKDTIKVVSKIRVGNEIEIEIKLLLCLTLLPSPIKPSY